MDYYYQLSQFNDLIDDMFESFYTPSWSPKLNIYETDENFIVKMPLPGVKTKDLTIDCKDDILSISGKIPSLKETNAKTVMAEHYDGSFQRSILLNSPIDRDNITAKLTDGILKLTLPKKNPTKTIEITID